MAPCRPFLFISFPRGFRLSSSNLGFFGCGVQLAPHSRSFPNSLRPSFPVPHYSLLRIWKTIRGRLPQLHCLAAGVERMHEWVQSQTRSRRTSCLFGKHPPAPAGKRKPGPPPKPKPTKEKEFLSCQCQSNSELRDNQLAHPRQRT